MQRLPATVRHCTRYIASGKLRTYKNHSGILDLTRLPSHDHPDALVTTFARGLPLSKALDSKRAGPGGGLVHCEWGLWSLIRQILEFSAALESEQSYHGDMTLDNALWDSSCNELTFIDFGNAGLTEQDPWKRTQRSGTMHLLAAIRERLEKDPHVCSGPTSCLAWLRSLKGEAAGPSWKGFGSMMSRLPPRWPNSSVASKVSLAASSASRAGMPSVRSVETLQGYFNEHAPKAVLDGSREGLEGGSGGSGMEVAAAASPASCGTSHEGGEGLESPAVRSLALSIASLSSAGEGSPFQVGSGSDEVASAMR